MLLTNEKCIYYQISKLNSKKNRKNFALAKMKILVTSAPGIKKWKKVLKNRVLYSLNDLQGWLGYFYTRGPQLKSLGGPKTSFCNIQGLNIICFYSFKGCFYQTNKVKEQNFWLCGPNWIFPRATFGPWAVCCACLFFTNHL